jgi:hypothetical protein
MIVFFAPYTWLMWPIFFFAASALVFWGFWFNRWTNAAQSLALVGMMLLAIAIGLVAAHYSPWPT